jgi:protein tyrosine phosphatase (PTP) superfamily phosphohydrolase (DUF442 family)
MITFSAFLREAPVGNFNQNKPRRVDKHLIRGGRPLNSAAIDELKQMGVDTVVCLLKKGKTYPAEIASADVEKDIVEKAGLDFVHISLDETIDPTPDDIKKFLDVMKKGGTVYAHCSAGQDRVGLLSAIYDVEVLGMSYEQAYQRYLEGGHDFDSWTNLDRFFYKYCLKKFGEPLDVETPVRAVVKNKRQGDWLIDYITKK